MGALRSFLLPTGVQIIYTLDEVAFIQNLVFYIEASYRTPVSSGNKGDGRLCIVPVFDFTKPFLASHVRTTVCGSAVTRPTTARRNSTLPPSACPRYVGALEGSVGPMM